MSSKLYVGFLDHYVHESDRSRFRGNGRAPFEEDALLACGRKTLLLSALSSLRASKSDAVGLLEASGCIICLIMA